ncbi:hypothetical protein ACFDTO_00120 [Microbacteriaceae bacterium 4G12]
MAVMSRKVEFEKPAGVMSCRVLPSPVRYTRYEATSLLRDGSQVTSVPSRPGCASTSVSLRGAVESRTSMASICTLLVGESASFAPFRSMRSVCVPASSPVLVKTAWA